MDIKIGITQSPRELVVDSAEDVDKVQEKVVAALKDDASVLELTDRRGRQFLVPSVRIAYVEIGEGARRVGFTAGD